MKRALLALMLAAMVLSTGCGNQAQEAAKDAQQKVEQKATEAKDAANAKVDEAKDAAKQTADDVAKKADEMKADANSKVDEAKDAANKAAGDATAKVDEMKSDADKMAKDAAAKVDEMATDMTSMMNERVIALNGIKPGASLEELKTVFGEATSVDGNTMTFADGLKVVLDGANKVKSISTTENAFDTAEGVYVGASEYSLNDYCGPADSVRVANGVAEYEYNSGDKKSIVVYKAQNGVITEIICSLK